MVGQFATQAQVAQHHIDIDVGAHGDHVRVHQAPGRVLGIGQHLLQPFAVLAVHRLEHFIDHRIGQVFDQVGQVVDVQVLDRGHDFVGVHLGQQAFADFLTDVQQHLAIVLGIDQAPDHLALARRQRLEQVADLGRRQGVDQSLDRSQPAAVQRIGEQSQLACGLVVAYSFGHARFPVGSWADRIRLRREGLAEALSRCGHRLHSPVREVPGYGLPASGQCRDGRARAAGPGRRPAVHRHRSGGSSGVPPAGWKDAG